MAGLYLHIPFCRKACHYCDFHFSTQLSDQNALTDALLQEIVLRKNELQEKIDTLYFGGGTPSVLSVENLQKIFQKLHENFEIDAQAEITLEANPEDLSLHFIEQIQKLGVNRLSIGVQSFRDADLQAMNRAHSAKMAIEAVQSAQKAGLNNLTLDLMYGLPELSQNAWQENLAQMFALQIPHFSAYCLTFEEKTVWNTWVKKNKMQPPLEEEVLKQWQVLLEAAEKQGFEQYEISNFAKNGQYSKHNLAYWQGKKYLGLGPAAHSFDGQSRKWNVRNNAIYLQKMQEKILPQEQELLTLENRLNERILTQLRTLWGIDLTHFERDFGTQLNEKLQQKSKKWQQSGELSRNKNALQLSRSGKIMADRIASDLFFDAQELQAHV